MCLSPQAGRWYRLAISCQGANTMQIYINGNLVMSFAKGA
jgi:hypothetical protein